jgi:hypothetical protein
MTTITREIVDRDELKLVLGCERRFVDTWTSREAADAYAKGQTKTPPMPALVGMGKAMMFHLSSVREWLLEYFQQGGQNAVAQVRGTTTRKGVRK